MKKIIFAEKKHVRLMKSNTYGSFECVLTTRMNVKKLGHAYGGIGIELDT
jgi:hypothetical protein